MRSIPLFGTTHADYLNTDVPCTLPLEDELVSTNYERNTGVQIINHFNSHVLDYRQIEMVLVGGHAPFTWGQTGRDAVDNSAMLEYIAMLAYRTERINPLASRLKSALVEKHHSRKHGPHAYYGQAGSKEDIRKSLWLTK